MSVYMCVCGGVKTRTQEKLPEKSRYPTVVPVTDFLIKVLRLILIS